MLTKQFGEQSPQILAEVCEMKTSVYSHCCNKAFGILPNRYCFFFLSLLAQRPLHWIITFSLQVCLSSSNSDSLQSSSLKVTDNLAVFNSDSLQLLTAVTDSPVCLSSAILILCRTNSLSLTATDSPAVVAESSHIVKARRVEFVTLIYSAWCWSLRSTRDCLYDSCNLLFEQVLSAWCMCFGRVSAIEIWGTNLIGHFSMHGTDFNKSFQMVF